MTISPISRETVKTLELNASIGIAGDILSHILGPCLRSLLNGQKKVPFDENLSP
jgi:hypothetical protein